MASNGRGGMRPQHSSRTPPFVLIGLLVVCAILAFNYWNASSKNSMLLKDMSELQDKYRTLSMKKVAVEKRNDALLEKVKETDTEVARQKDLIGAKDDEFTNLRKVEGELQAQLEDARSNLNSCEDKQQTCLGSLSTMEQKFNDSELNLNKANEECSNRISAMGEEDRKSCDEKLSQARVDLITKIQQFFGYAAMTALQEVGVDLTGVNVDTNAVGSISLCPSQPQANNIPQVNNNLPSNNGFVGGNNIPLDNVQQQPQLNPGLVGGDPQNVQQFVGGSQPIGLQGNIQPPVQNQDSNNPGVVNDPNQISNNDPNALPQIPANPDAGANPDSQGNPGVPNAQDVPAQSPGEGNPAPAENRSATTTARPKDSVDPADEAEKENPPIGVPIGQEPGSDDQEVKSGTTAIPKGPELQDDGPQANLQAPPGLDENDDEENLAPIGVQDARDGDKEDDFDDEIDPNEKNEALKFDADKEQDVNGAADVDGDDDTIDNMHQKMNDDIESLDSPQNLNDQIDM